MSSGHQAFNSARTDTPGSRMPQSELGSFLAPLIAGVTGVWKRFHFVTLGALGVYAVSGVTIIEANEVGVILRLGEVVRSNGEPITHPPGIVFALPKPFDEVLTVEVDRIDTITVNELAPPSWQTLSGEAIAEVDAPETVGTTIAPLELAETIDPEAYGYALSADRNILHAQIIVRYRVADPVEFELLTYSPSDILRSAVLQSTVKVAGETRLDDILGSGREDFSRAVSMDSQIRLERIGAGLEVVSLEFENLSPPEQVADDFDAVQSAFIEAQTTRQEAHSYAATVVPASKATANEMIVRAEKLATALVSTVRSDANTFAALLPSYRASPVTVRQRLYREGLERALDQAGRVVLVPAPPPEGYRGARFSISTVPVRRKSEALASDASGLEAREPVDENVPSVSLLSIQPLNSDGGHND